MTSGAILDTAGLVADLKLLVEYASRVGVLRDKSVLETLQKAQQSLYEKNQQPDVYSLNLALNEVAQVISPVTLSDLKFGRDPLSDNNQRHSKCSQFFLTLFTLANLVLIGYFMHALRIEQDAISAVDRIQELHPQQKLTSLRKMAQYDEPMNRKNTLYDEFHRQVSELRQINASLNSTYTQANEASRLPLFPFENTFADTKPIKKFSRASAFVASAQAQDVSNEVQPKNIESNGGVLKKAALPSGKLNGMQAAQLNRKSGTTAKESASPPHALAASADSSEFCAAETNGNMRLPLDAHRYPHWMKTILSDALNDFCFQLKVLSPGGDGALLNHAIGQLAFISSIKNKMSLRVTWFLPFLYGLLGAAIFLMRNVANVRTPAMGGFPIVMRLSLGGVAGIVIGWFSNGAATNFGNDAALSIPFALAFITGYGIDVLFNVLDRLTRAISEVGKAK